MSGFRWTVLGLSRSSLIDPLGVTLKKTYFDRDFLENCKDINLDSFDPLSFSGEDTEFLVFVIRHNNVSLMVSAGSSWLLEESSTYFNVFQQRPSERKFEDVNFVEAVISHNERTSAY